MSDYISRQAAIDALPKPKICEYMDEFGAGRNSCAYDAEKAIEDVSSADVVPVVHGRWEHGKCNLCGEHAPYWCLATTYHESMYCPSCGAKMDEHGEG